MNFKKFGPFIGESCSWDFSAPSCQPSTFIDLATTALANRRCVKTICMVLGSNSTHMIVTSPVYCKQRGLFWGSYVPGKMLSLVAIQALFLTFQTLPCLKKVCKNHMHGLRELEYPYGCTGPVKSKQPGRFFCGNHAPGILRTLAAIQTHLLSSQKLQWLLNIP